MSSQFGARARAHSNTADDDDNFLRLAETAMATLHELPVELLEHIHLMSLSPALPLVSRHLYTTFKYSSVLHKALYLTRRHDKSTLSHAIKYPICNLEVVHALERIAARRNKQLRCSELPRRLVNSFTTSLTDLSNHDRSKQQEYDLMLIKYLLEQYSASPNSKKGYILARAVFARHERLIKLLLKHGADPSLKGGWAVLAAINMGDLSLVKLLMDTDADRGLNADSDQSEEYERQALNGKRRRSSNESTLSTSKRVKTEPKCRPSSEMLEAAVRGEHWDIVTYLEDKGARPSLDVLKLL
ncbi:hypothetical protein OIO90_001423 [Microbotryomycetes sp. JL221]|nr:hypothetical protein OIO90_001423 [Microbotryomycetes sp. JL221]